MLRPPSSSSCVAAQPHGAALCLFLPPTFLFSCKQNAFALLVLFPVLTNILLCHRDYQNSVLLVMVTSVFVSLEMGSVAAITKQDSVQISFDVSEQNV